MSFQPIVVGSGLVGWQFLKATQEKQKNAFDNSPVLARDTDYFAANIRSISSAEDLVSDRRLLRVALGAFGLQDDIDNRFFIRKVLEEGTTDRDALANKLADDRYKALSRAFAFDALTGPRTGQPSFGEEIVAKFRAQEFEVAVGLQDSDLRLALNFERSLPEIAASSGSDDTKWFRIMGTPPLRTVFELTFGLPTGFGQLDIDKQLEVFRDKANSRFGVKDIEELSSPELMNRIVQTFLLQSQIRQSSQASAGQIALNLLQAIPRRSLLG